jgi:hypothetical protein
MAINAIYCGVLLIIVGVVGYFYGMSIGHASPTALIPAAFGLLLTILGFVARAKDNLRKHIMHVAVLVGLIGFILPAGRLLINYATFTWSAATISQLAMAVICLVFVILCVKSFIDARRGENI